MKVHCNECSHEGEAVTNSRNQTRCEACYSQNVTPIADAPEIAADKPAESVSVEPESEPVVKPHKRSSKAAK